MTTGIEWTDETPVVDRGGRRIRIYHRSMSGPPKAIRRAQRDLGLAWCRHCEQWLAIAEVRKGLCRDGRNEDYRLRYAANPDAIRRRVHARKRGVDPVPAEGVEVIADQWGETCAYCDEPATSFDHVIPVIQGGPTRRTNIVPACGSCNSRKGAGDPGPWIERGMVIHPSRWAHQLELIITLEAA